MKTTIKGLGVKPDELIKKMRLGVDFPRRRQVQSFCKNLEDEIPDNFVVQDMTDVDVLRKKVEIFNQKKFSLEKSRAKAEAELATGWKSNDIQVVEGEGGTKNAQGLAPQRSEEPPSTETRSKNET